MQYFPREKAVLVLVASSLILFAFMLLMSKNTLTNVSAVTTNGVMVYWDRNCNNPVSSIDWGNLTPGSVKDVVVYIRNEVEEPIYLFRWTTNWNPSEASRYLNLRWDYSGQRMNPNEILQITLTMHVSRYIREISSFSFDIVITGSDILPGDVNGDGIVNIVDIVLTTLAFESQPDDPNWNPIADLNQDGTINIIDLVLIAMNYGRTVQ